jgi:hypothetical protein
VSNAERGEITSARAAAVADGGLALFGFFVFSFFVDAGAADAVAAADDDDDVNDDDFDNNDDDEEEEDDDDGDADADDDNGDNDDDDDEDDEEDDVPLIDRLAPTPLLSARGAIIARVRLASAVARAATSLWLKGMNPDFRQACIFQDFPASDFLSTGFAGSFGIDERCFCRPVFRRRTQKISGSKGLEGGRQFSQPQPIVKQASLA